MPFVVKFRPGATRFRDNDLRDLHPRASYAFDQTVAWIESGLQGGGPDLEDSGYSLDNICDYLIGNAVLLGMPDHIVHSRVEMLRRHKLTGRWHFMFLLVPLQQPVVSLVMLLGFNREHPENKEFLDAEHAREIICDTLLGWVV